MILKWVLQQNHQVWVFENDLLLSHEAIQEHIKLTVQLLLLNLLQ